MSAAAVHASAERTPQSIHDVFGSYDQSTPSILPRRPTHRRGRSTRVETFEIFREIRHIFQRGLTNSWGKSADFKALAKHFYAVAIGLSPGHIVRRYSLNQFQTALLALELSRVVNTSAVIFITDSTNQHLIVCHTHTLIKRIGHADNTLLVECTKGHIAARASAHSVPWLGEAKDFVRQMLLDTNHQVVQLSELNWPSHLIKRRMFTVSDWLVDAPVCYILNEDPQTDQSIRDLLPHEAFLTLAIRLDGHEPENEYVDLMSHCALLTRFPSHTCDAWLVPMSLFASVYDVENRSPLLVDGLSETPTMTSISDRMQSTIFEQLNNSELAGKIWSDSAIIHA